MKALVYHGPGQIAWEEKPMPTLQDPGDVLVRISKTTICGTDLAILKGGVATVTPGRITPRPDRPTAPAAARPRRDRRR